jgi:hypothetical protein
MINTKQRSIWKNLLFALAATPGTALLGIIIITLIGALDQAMTKIDLSGHGWVILILAYVLSLIYFLCEPKIRLNRERRKVVNGLILYWEDQLAKQNNPDPSEKEIEVVYEMLLERFKMWAWFDAELWNRYFPNERYSKSLFGLVDNFMGYWKNQREGQVP